MRCHSILFLCFFLFMLFSCKDKVGEVSSNTIPLQRAIDSNEYNVHYLSSYADSLSYVPLEMDSDLFIGRPKGYCMEQGRIFVYDDYLCLVYSSTTGELLGQIGRIGQGPGEYPAIESVEVLPEISRVFIYTNIGSVLEYQLDGSFVRSIRPPFLKDESIWDISSPNGSVFIADLISWNNLKNEFVLFDSTSTIKYIHKCPWETSKPEGRGYSSYEAAVMYRYKDTVRYMKRQNDTLFSIDSNWNVTSTYIMSQGKYKLPAKELSDTEAWKSYVYISNVRECENYMFFSFDFGNYAPDPFEKKGKNRKGKEIIIKVTTVLGIHNKQTLKFELLANAGSKSIGLKNDIDYGPDFWPGYISDNQEMIMLRSAEEFLNSCDSNKVTNPELKEILRNMKEDDNPIAIIAKLKK